MKTENTTPKKGFLWHFVHVHSLWFEFPDELFSYPEMSILSYVDNVRTTPTFKENMGEDFYMKRHMVTKKAMLDSIAEVKRFN